MKWTVLLAMGLVGVFAARPARTEQAASAASTYVDENPTEPAPLKLNGLEGQVRGLGGDPMPRVPVSLFTEDKHQFVATVMTGKDGKFKFDKVEKGLYRVVARAEGLCPANIPVLIESSLLAHRKLEITMQPKDLDRCSYGMAKN